MTEFVGIDLASSEGDTTHRLTIVTSKACGDCSHGIMSHADPRDVHDEGFTFATAGKCGENDCTCPEFMDFGDSLAPKVIQPEDDISEQERSMRDSVLARHGRLLKLGFRRRARKCTYCGSGGMIKKGTNGTWLCVSCFSKQNPGLVDESPNPQI